MTDKRKNMFIKFTGAPDGESVYVRLDTITATWVPDTEKVRAVGLQSPVRETRVGNAVVGMDGGTSFTVQEDIATVMNRLSVAFDAL